jgi:hypothetical protein
VSGVRRETGHVTHNPARRHLHGPRELAIGYPGSQAQLDVFIQREAAIFDPARWFGPTGWLTAVPAETQTAGTTRRFD